MFFYIRKVFKFMFFGGNIEYVFTSLRFWTKLDCAVNTFTMINSLLKRFKLSALNSLTSLISVIVFMLVRLLFEILCNQSYQALVQV